MRSDLTEIRPEEPFFFCSFLAFFFFLSFFTAPFRRSTAIGRLAVEYLSSIFDDPCPYLARSSSIKRPSNSLGETSHTLESRAPLNPRQIHSETH